MPNSQCIFCTISKNSENLVYEDKHTIAFMDIKPVTLGHTLVIPKQHFATFLDATPEIVGFVNSTTHKIAMQLQTLIPEIKGFNILTNNGSEAYQEVFHYHVHIIPKYNKEKGLILTHTTEDVKIENIKTIKQSLKTKFM
ncbi:HIT family protein [Spiroplasma endosymbiont of Nebria brevicollis]|uniref:HIT family protein n=1 Tax=Spiroplasma endosymbiont of Nebria brevicollis TaxID=3066284 RepID=UPI00313DEA60